MFSTLILVVTLFNLRIFTDRLGARTSPSHSLHRSSEADETAPVIIFIHGLSGSSKATWSKMTSLCQSDAAMNRFHFDCFAFNTQLIRMPFQNRMPKLQELSAGLETEIALRHRKRSKIYLVGHSLGGLIARQYVVTGLKRNIPLNVAGILLFSTPNTGADLAAIGKKLSWNHGHLKQLCKNSDILEILNEDWLTLKVEQSINVRYVLGGNDAIVERTSSSPYIGNLNTQTLINQTHSSIIAPDDHSDIRYETLRRFIFDCDGEVRQRSSERIETIQGDPLFEIYNVADEPYYFERCADNDVKKHIGRGVVWLTGVSGVGKTTVLRHMFLSSGWKLGQLMLASYPANDAEGLLRAMCVELGDLQGSADTIGKAASIPEMVSFFRKQLRLIPDGTILALLVEEIPINTQEATSDFLDFILKLLLAIESDFSLSGRFILAFSSINDPSPSIGIGKVKLRERLQVIQIPSWSNQEASMLVSLLCNEANLVLNDDEQQEIAQSASGSPRFIKMVLRKLKYDATAPLSKVIADVRAEQI
ncbi:hypothetical protein G3A39_39380 [Paraburkholderia aspalathi]|nr:hypothetical protein [Paraburkholderia aspalathi]